MKDSGVATVGDASRGELDDSDDSGEDGQGGVDERLTQESESSEFSWRLAQWLVGACDAAKAAAVSASWQLPYAVISPQNISSDMYLARSSHPQSAHNPGH